MLSVALHTCVSKPTTEDRPILSAAKIKPRDPSFYQGKFYADIRWGSLERGRQMRVGWSKIVIFASFARYIFRTFTSNATLGRPEPPFRTGLYSAADVFFSPRVLRDPMTDRPETLPHGRNLA